jgi:hypothetical protein
VNSSRGLRVELLIYFLLAFRIQEKIMNRNNQKYAGHSTGSFWAEDKRLEPALANGGNTALEADDSRMARDRFSLNHPRGNDFTNGVNEESENILAVCNSSLYS